MLVPYKYLSRIAECADKTGSLKASYLAVFQIYFIIYRRQFAHICICKTLKIFRILFSTILRKGYGITKVAFSHFILQQNGA